MKTLITFLTLSVLFTVNISAQESTQEIIIVGTMHTVPKTVKRSYKPMLRKAKKYNPEAIFVESPMADDDKSWEYLKRGWSKNYQKFYELSDSLQQHFSFDKTKYNQLLLKNHSELSSEEINYLITSFAFQRDNGNYEYYSYLLKHGVKGSKKPTRHEDGDLTYPLALYLQHKKVFNMDDQQTNGEYHEAWRKCSKEGVSNGNNAIINQLNKKDYKAAVFPAIFRGLGKHTNKRKSLARLHKMSSFSYVAKDTEGCKEGRKYWNERNSRMADNIANQVRKMKKKKNMVIVGAAHVIGLENALKQKYPSLKVILINDY